jgi:hypothetical protein
MRRSRRPRRGKNAKDEPPSEPEPPVTPEMQAAFGEYLASLPADALTWIRRNSRRLRSLARGHKAEKAAYSRRRKLPGSHADPQDARYSAKRPYSPQTPSETLAAHAAGRPDKTASPLRESRATVGRENLTADPAVRERGIGALGSGRRAYRPGGYWDPVPEGYHAARLRAEFDGQAAIMLGRAQDFYEATREEFPTLVQLRAAVSRQRALLDRLAGTTGAADTAAASSDGMDYGARLAGATSSELEHLLPARLQSLAASITTGLARVLDLPPERTKGGGAPGPCQALRLHVALAGMQVSSKGSRWSTTERALDLLEESCVEVLYRLGPARAALEAVAFVLGRSVDGVRKAAARGRGLTVVVPKPTRLCATCGVGHYFRLPEGRWRCWWCHPPDRRRRPTQIETLEVRTRAAVGPAMHGEVLAWSRRSILTPAQTAELIAETLPPRRK